MYSISEEKLKAALDNVKSRKSENSASENVKQFYHNHEPYINSCYNYYLQYERHKADYVESVQYEIEEFKKELKGKIILVLTANSIEEGVLLHSLVKVGKQKLGFYFINDHAYHICHFKDNTIVHVHTDKTGENFTRRTINAAENIFKPDTIVLLGICYGFDFDKYELGNVLISSGLKTYRLNFRDSNEDEETVFDAQEEEYKTPNQHLFSMIKQIIRYRQIYSFIPENNGTLVSIRCEEGIVLSSNSLMSSKRVKEAVINAFGSAKPKPIGGEMEGGGLLTTKIVEEQRFERWLIVKGICDWGEKKNLLDKDPKISMHMKDSIQAMAMVHASSVFFEMLMQECFIR